MSYNNLWADNKPQEFPKPERPAEVPGKPTPDTPLLPPDQPEIVPPEKPVQEPPQEVPPEEPPLQL